MRPDFCGIKIEPSIPKEWDYVEIEKDFRGNHLHIIIRNSEHQESGYKKMIVNGKEMNDNYIPVEYMTNQTEVELIMS